MDNNNAEISCSVPLSGFSSTPSIEYSNIDDKSRGFIDYTSKKPVIV